MKLFAKIMIVSAVAAGCASALAASRTWNGNGFDGSYSDSDNWSSQAAPVCGDDATITSIVGGGVWPVLDDDYGLQSVTLGGGAQMNFNNHVLFVENGLTIASGGATFTGGASGGFEVSDVNSGNPISVPVTFNEGTYVVNPFASCP